MPMRHAQRKHIIHSLDSLLYQLHTLSFLLSPSIWTYICRVSSQFQFSRPRDMYPTRSLRFWFILVLLFNSGGVWSHATEGAAEGRSVILDFVGIAHVPSKLHLLLLDFLIIFLEMVLTTIAYETSLSSEMPPDTPDPLLPIPPNSAPDSMERSKSSQSLSYERPYVIDLHFSTILEHLRHPPPLPPRDTSAGELLPLPNTTSWQLSSSLRMLLRARAQMRERARAPAVVPDRSGREESGEEPRRVPGGMDTEDT